LYVIIISIFYEIKRMENSPWQHGVGEFARDVFGGNSDGDDEEAVNT
jgi:hypothetical protein